jgi:hypothetical protein
MLQVGATGKRENCGRSMKRVTLVWRVRRLELRILMRGVSLFGVELHAFRPGQISQYNYWLRTQRWGFDLNYGGDFSHVYCIPSNILWSSSRGSTFPWPKLTSHGYNAWIFASAPHVSRNRDKSVGVATCKVTFPAGARFLSSP